MDIVTPNPHGILKVEELKSFEEKLGNKLPNDYRDYLISYNGGVPNPNHFGIQNDGTESRIHHFYGLNNGPDYQKLDHIRDIYSGRVPESVLPIADDPFGNLICIGIDDDCFGEILFWDHEMELQGSDRICLKRISPTFTQFILSMNPFDGETDYILKMIKENNIESIIEILDSGYNIETNDEYGRTMMENAAIFNQPEIIQMLHDRGAKLRNSLNYANSNLEFFPDQKETVSLIKKLRGTP